MPKEVYDKKIKFQGRRLNMTSYGLLEPVETKEAILRTKAGLGEDVGKILIDAQIFTETQQVLYDARTDIDDKEKLWNLFRRQILWQCQVCWGYHGPPHSCPLKKKMDVLVKRNGLVGDWGRLKGALYYETIPDEHKKMPKIGNKRSRTAANFKPYTYAAYNY